MAPRTRTPKEKTPAVEPDAPVEVPAEEGKAADVGIPDGVLIVKNVDEQGNLSVNVVPTGNVQITEVQTIIEVGLRFFREQLGLGQAPR